jgi:hypothetical protein
MVRFLQNLDSDNRVNATALARFIVVFKNLPGLNLNQLIKNYEDDDDFGTSFLEKTMKLLHDLFFTDYGLMSFIGLAFMLGMGVFFLRLFLSGEHAQP